MWLAISAPGATTPPPCAPPPRRAPQVRLAWHSAGTYNKADGTGGSNGATMRFTPESEHGANAGLAVARSLLEPIKAKFPWISYGDLWTLAGCVAVESMGGEDLGARGLRAAGPQGRGSVQPHAWRHSQEAGGAGWRGLTSLPLLAGRPHTPNAPGPTVPWKPGRVDQANGASCPPDGRLPDASLGAAHIRDVFGRMGFSDR
jgi:cytochrome c peroxidase